MVHSSDSSCRWLHCGCGEHRLQQSNTRRTVSVCPDSRGVGIRVPVGERFFSCPRRPDRFWDPPSLLSNACPRVGGGGKRPWFEADHSPPPSVEVFMAQCFSSWAQWQLGQDPSAMLVTQSGLTVLLATGRSRSLHTLPLNKQRRVCDMAKSPDSSYQWSDIWVMSQSHLPLPRLFVSQGLRPSYSHSNHNTPLTRTEARKALLNERLMDGRNKVNCINRHYIQFGIENTEAE
jgi:hypothetical protein